VIKLLIAPIFQKHNWCFNGDDWAKFRGSD